MQIIDNREDVLTVALAKSQINGCNDCSSHSAVKTEILGTGT